MSRRATPLLAALTAALTLLSACSGGDADPSAQASDGAAPMAAPQPTVGGGSEAVAGSEAPAGPAPLPEATAGPELAVALEESLTGQVSEVTGLPSTIDCPDEATGLTDGYTCIALPEGGGARQVIVRLVEGGYGYQLAINAPLLEEYLVGEVPDAQSVDCPDDAIGAPDARFDCTLTRTDGTTTGLTVTQTDAAGNVEFAVADAPAPAPEDSAAPAPTEG